MINFDDYTNENKLILIGHIFINSENSRTLKPHFLTLKLVNKLDLRFGEKVIAL